MSKRAFVTVGTTDFDALVTAIDNKEFLMCLRYHGFATLAIQIGRGQYSPSQVTDPEVSAQVGVSVSCFRFKDTLQADMESADLVISHCGAGSILEAVTLGKQLIVVVNDSLQDNHQTELADALVEMGYCLSARPNNLLDVLGSTMTRTSEGSFERKLFPINDPGLLPAILESLSK
jgi:beta-1,4-N-acetylglucosaminyltransferase